MITDFQENLPIIIRRFDSKKDKREIIKFLKSLASNANIVAILNFREDISGEGFYFDVITEHMEYVHQTPTLDRYIINFNKERKPVKRARKLTLRWLRIITKILNKNKNLYPIEKFTKKLLDKSLDRPESCIYPFDDFRIGYIAPTYLRNISKIVEVLEPGKTSTITKFTYRCMRLNYTGVILLMSDKSLGDVNDTAQKIHDYLLGIGRYDILLGVC